MHGGSRRRRASGLHECSKWDVQFRHRSEMSDGMFSKWRDLLQPSIQGRATNQALHSSVHRRSTGQFVFVRRSSRQVGFSLKRLIDCFTATLRAVVVVALNRSPAKASWVQSKNIFPTQHSLRRLSYKKKKKYTICFQ